MNGSGARTSLVGEDVVRRILPRFWRLRIRLENRKRWKATASGFLSATSGFGDTREEAVDELAFALAQAVLPTKLRSLGWRVFEQHDNFWLREFQGVFAHSGEEGRVVIVARQLDSKDVTIAVRGINSEMPEVRVTAVTPGIVASRGLLQAAINSDVQPDP